MIVPCKYVLTQYDQHFHAHTLGYIIQCVDIHRELCNHCHIFLDQMLIYKDFLISFSSGGIITFLLGSDFNTSINAITSNSSFFSEVV